MDFSTNYCGMYWSDGRFQSSVADGKSVPVNLLDEQCKSHDAAYAQCEDDRCLDKADQQFHDKTRELGLRGKLYGKAVLHGNQLIRGTQNKMLNIAYAILGKKVPSLDTRAKAPAFFRGSNVAPAPAKTVPGTTSKPAVEEEDDVPTVPVEDGTCDMPQLPAGGHPTQDGMESPVYGAIPPHSNLFGFHNQILPVYKPLKKKKNTYTEKEKEKFFKQFIQLHPPTTKHYKNCKQCHVLKQSPEYQRLLSLLGTPSGVPKRR